MTKKSGKGIELLEKLTQMILWRTALLRHTILQNHRGRYISRRACASAGSSIRQSHSAPSIQMHGIPSTLLALPFLCYCGTRLPRAQRENMLLLLVVVLQHGPLADTWRSIYHQTAMCNQM
jgi:hypothetical protein